VENDLKYGRFIYHAFLQNSDLEVVVLATANECLETLDMHPDLICIDLALSDMSSDELLLKIATCNKNLSVLVFKVQDDANIAVEFLKLGTVRYVVSNDHLASRLIGFENVASDIKCLKNEVEPFGESAQVDSDLECFNSEITDSKIVRELKAIVELARVLVNENKVNIIGSDFLRTVPATTFVPTDKTLREYSVGIISWYLERYNQNVVKVADKLDIGKSTIYNMIKSGEITLNK